MYNLNPGGCYKVINKLLLTLGLACFLYNTQAVAIQTDSLQHALDIAGNDTARVILLNTIAEQISTYKPDSSHALSLRALGISQKSGWQKGIAMSYLELGLLAMRNGNYQPSLKYLSQSLPIFEILKDTLYMAQVNGMLGQDEQYNGHTSPALNYFVTELALAERANKKEEVITALCNMGNVHYVHGEAQTTFSYFFKALRVAEDLGDKYRVSICLADIGNYYANNALYDSALLFDQRALKIAEDANSKKAIAYCYGKMGFLYNFQKNYSKTMEYYQKALSINQQLGNKIITANWLNTIGRLYLKEGNTKEALNYCFKSLQLSEEMGNEESILTRLCDIGKVYTRQKDYANALIYIQRASKLAFKSKAYGYIQDIELALASVYKQTGRSALALEHYEIYMAYSDSVREKAKEKDFIQRSLNYEFDKKETIAKAEQDKQHALQMAELKQQKQQKLIFILGVIVMLLIAVVLLNRLLFARKTQRQLSEKNIEIEKQKLRAEQSEKFKEQFLANMSHEIRTPMNAVLGMTNLLIDTPLNEKQKKYLSAVKKSSENLLVILNDILDLSKLESGKMELENLPFRLQEQVNHAMDIMRFKADEKGLLFTSEIADDVPPVVLGDAARLNQILINLLSNAIKFTAKGQVKLSISTAGESKIKFSIADTGIGMTGEQQAKIFESFTQAESNTSRKYGGTGLGLAISKTLVELQGGNLEVKSEPGHGSEFSFTIAYATGDEKDMATGDGTAAIDYSALSKLNILIAEDYEFNQIVIKDTLEQLIPGITIDIAVNGKMAVEKVRKGNYDIILMDVHMPEMDGYEAARYIRNNLKMDIPIIALTASVIKSDLDKCIAAGMNSYIPKPFEREQLMHELMKHKPLSTHV